MAGVYEIQGFPARSVGRTIGGAISAYRKKKAAEELAKEGISCEIIDVRILNPFHSGAICESVKKTGKLCVVDGAWRTAGMSAEVIATVMEQVGVGVLDSSPIRVTLPDASAPSSKFLEDIYYPDANDVADIVRKLVQQG